MTSLPPPPPLPPIQNVGIIDSFTSTSPKPRTYRNQNHYRSLPFNKTEFILLNTIIRKGISLHTPKGRSLQTLIRESRVPSRSLSTRLLLRQRREQLGGGCNGIDMNVDVGIRGSIRMHEKLIKRRKVMDVFAWERERERERKRERGNGDLIRATYRSNPRMQFLLSKLPPLQMRGVEKASTPSSPQILREIDWSRQEQFWRQIRNIRPKSMIEKLGAEEDVLALNAEVKEEDIKQCVCPGAWVTNDNTPNLEFSTTEPESMPEASTPSSNMYEEILPLSEKTEGKNELIQTLRKSIAEARQLKEIKIQKRQLQLSLTKGKEVSHSALERRIGKMVWATRNRTEDVWNEAVAAQKRGIVEIATASLDQMADSRTEFPFPKIEASELKVKWSRASIDMVVDMAAQEEIYIADSSESKAERGALGGGQICGPERPAFVTEHVRMQEVEWQSSEDPQVEEELEKNKIFSPGLKGNAEAQSDWLQDSPRSVNTQGPSTPKNLAAIQLFHSAERSLQRSTSSRYPKALPSATDLGQQAPSRGLSIGQYQDQVIKPTPTSENGPLLHKTTSPVTSQLAFSDVFISTGAQTPAPGSELQTYSLPKPPRPLCDAKININTTSMRPIPVSPTGKIKAAQSALQIMCQSPSSSSSSLSSSSFPSPSSQSSPSPSSAAPRNRKESSPCFPTPIPASGFGLYESRERATSNCHVKTVAAVAHENKYEDAASDFGINSSVSVSVSVSENDNGRYDLTISEGEAESPDAVGYKKSAATTRRRLGYGKMKQLTEASISLNLRMQGLHDGVAESSQGSFLKGLRSLSRRRINIRDDRTKLDHASLVPDGLERMANLKEAPTSFVTVPESRAPGRKKLSKAPATTPNRLFRSESSQTVPSHLHESDDLTEEVRQSFSFTKTSLMIPTRSLARLRKPPNKYQKARMTEHAAALAAQNDLVQSPRFVARSDSKFAKWTPIYGLGGQPIGEEREKETGGTGMPCIRTLQAFVETEENVNEDEDEEDVHDNTPSEAEWLANLRIGTAETMSLARPRSEVTIVHVNRPGYPPTVTSNDNRGSNDSGERSESGYTPTTTFPPLDSAALGEPLMKNESLTSMGPTMSPIQPASSLLSSGKTSEKRATIVVENPHVAIQERSEQENHHKRVDSKGLFDPPSIPYSSKNNPPTTVNLCPKDDGNFRGILSMEEDWGQADSTEEGSMKSSPQQSVSDGEYGRKSSAATSVAATFEMSSSGLKSEQTKSLTNSLDMNVEGDGTEGGEDRGSIMTSKTHAKDGRGKRERVKRFFRIGR